MVSFWHLDFLELRDSTYDGIASRLNNFVLSFNTFKSIGGGAWFFITESGGDLLLGIVICY